MYYLAGRNHQDRMPEWQRWRVHRITSQRLWGVILDWFVSLDAETNHAACHSATYATNTSIQLSSYLCVR
jgi:hypothetical protein